MCSIGPGSFARGVDLYYKTEEEFLFASADAMRDEYKAIVDAGIVLQIDDPSLPDNWDMINPEPPLKEFKKFEQVRMEALNHALRGLPADRIRFHICWGSWHGPHTTDIPLKDIVDLVLSVNAGAYSVEAGNVRHEHEWRVWQDAKLPDGKLLIPGVVSHATNIVEHPAGRGRPHRALRQGGRPRERHRRHRLRARRPHPSTNRLGQIAGARRRCQARDQRALGIVGHVAGRLAGKVALISGAGCIGPGWGNGRAAAVLFAREGAKVFAVDKDADSMTETVARVGNDGEIATHVCDVLDDAQVRDMTEACRKAFGRIDILVNNVGGSAAGGVAEMSEETFDRQIDYNLKSVFLACRHVIPVMIAQGGGAIVNTASASGTRYTGAPQIGYASAKAAVIQFSRVTAVQYAGERHPREHGDSGPDAHPHGGSASGQAAHRRRRRGLAQIPRRPHPARFHGGRARYGGRRIIFGLR